jgi:hypothetical protein
MPHPLSANGSSCSIGDPDPHGPHVFGPSGSGSISQKNGSGSGSFPFVIKVLSGLKIMFAKLNFNTKF